MYGVLASTCIQDRHTRSRVRLSRVAGQRMAVGRHTDAGPSPSGRSSSRNKTTRGPFPFGRCRCRWRLTESKGKNPYDPHATACAVRGREVPGVPVPEVVSGRRLPHGPWLSGSTRGGRTEQLPLGGLQLRLLYWAGPKAHQYTSAGCLESMSLKSGPSICFVLERESIWSHKKRKKENVHFSSPSFHNSSFFLP